MDNRANLIVKVDNFLSCHKLQLRKIKIPDSEKHERDEIVPLREAGVVDPHRGFVSRSVRVPPTGMGS